MPTDEPRRGGHLPPLALVAEIDLSPAIGQTRELDRVLERVAGSAADIVASIRELNRELAQTASLAAGVTFPGGTGGPPAGPSYYTPGGRHFPGGGAPASAGFLPSAQATPIRVTLDERDDSTIAGGIVAQAIGQAVPTLLLAAGAARQTGLLDNLVDRLEGASLGGITLEQFAKGYLFFRGTNPVLQRNLTPILRGLIPGAAAGGVAGLLPGLATAGLGLVGADLAYGGLRSIVLGTPLGEELGRTATGRFVAGALPFGSRAAGSEFRRRHGLPDPADTLELQAAAAGVVPISYLAPEDARRQAAATAAGAEFRRRHGLAEPLAPRRYTVSGLAADLPLISELRRELRSLELPDPQDVLESGRVRLDSSSRLPELLTAYATISPGSIGRLQGRSLLAADALESVGLPGLAGVSRDFAGIAGEGIDKIESPLRRLDERAASAEARFRGLAEASDLFADTATSGLVAVAAGMQSVGELARSLLQTIAALVLEAAVLTPLRNTISSAFSTAAGGIIPSIANPGRGGGGTSYTPSLPGGAFGGSRDVVINNNYQGVSRSQAIELAAAATAQAGEDVRRARSQITSELYAGVEG